MSDDDKKKDENPYDFFKLKIDPEQEKKNGGGGGPKKPRRIPFWSLLLIALAIFLVINLIKGRNSISSIPYSEFRQNIIEGKFKKVELSGEYYVGYFWDINEKPLRVMNQSARSVQKESDQESADGTQKVAETETETDESSPTLPVAQNTGNVASKNAGSQNETRAPVLPFLGSMKSENRVKTSAIYSESISRLLDECGVEYSFIERKNNFFLSFLLQMIVPFLFLILIYFFIFRRMGGGMGGMGSVLGNGGKSKAVDEGKVKTRFSDVAGVDEAKEELMEVVDFLKSPKKYTDIGGKIPKGVLLVGPPGTGKTLLARAVAGEAGVPFFRISGSDFVEMFVGVGASRVRDLFKTAREKAPCIVFIDEIDALGKNRMNGFGGGNDEREQTLNQLLVEMDGFDNEKGLIILAATNRADILDPALLRPGRFDRHVPVEKPDVKGREEILRIHAKNVKLDDDVDFDSVAHGTAGFAGADLANVVNEAALLAVRNGRKKVSMVDFNDAIDKVSIGLKKKNRRENEKERKLVAYHETGHALVGAFTPDYPPVNKITVVPRSHGVGGFTQYREKEETFFKTKKDMMGEVDSLLGGRAAEQIMLGDVSTGASNDISVATAIIKSMIVDYGMSEKFKNMTLGKGVRGNRGGEPELVREFSEETQKYIDEEIARIMDERYNYVVKLLSKHKSLLEYIANRLLEKETIDGKEFDEIVKAEGHALDLEDKSKKKAAIESKPESAPRKGRTSKSSEGEEKPKRGRRIKKSE